MEGIISWWAGVSAAGMFPCCKGFRVPAQSRETMKGQAGYPSVYQYKPSRLIFNHWLTPLVWWPWPSSRIPAHSCPLRAAPTLSKALTLPPSSSSLLPRRSARRIQWIQLVFIPLLLWWWAYSTHQTRQIFLSLALRPGGCEAPLISFLSCSDSSFWSMNTAELLPTHWCQQTPVNTEAEFTVSNRPELILQSSSWSQRDLGWGCIGVSELLSCIYEFLQVYISVCTCVCAHNQLYAHQHGARLLSQHCLVTDGSVTVGDTALQLIKEKDD